MKTQNADAQITKFMDAVQIMVSAHYADGPTDPTITTQNGRRYAKVVCSAWGQTSVFCFVDRTTGDVMKAEGWSKPAKHARSNVFADDCGMSGVNAYGANYNYR